MCACDQVIADASSSGWRTAEFDVRDGDRADRDGGVFVQVVVVQAQPVR